jgi:hypothetical protein
VIPSVLGLELPQTTSQSPHASRTTVSDRSATCRAGQEATSEQRSLDNRLDALKYTTLDMRPVKRPRWQPSQSAEFGLVPITGVFVPEFRAVDMRVVSPRARQTGQRLGFLAGGDEMGALMRAHDWEATSVGAPETWPQSLRTTVRLPLNTQHPMFIWRGPELVQFYNDAYRQTMGPERHPRALGQRGRECWEEIWDIIGTQIDHVMTGQGATWHEDHLVRGRHGEKEDVWWTYSFSPIDDDTTREGLVESLYLQRCHRTASNDGCPPLQRGTPSART